MIEVFEGIYRFGAAFAAPVFFMNLMIKGTLILCAAGILYVLFRRSSAAVRHWVWSLAFYSLLSLPVLSFMLPGKTPTWLPEISTTGWFGDQSYNGKWWPASTPKSAVSENSEISESRQKEIPNFVPLSLQEKVYLKDCIAMGNMVNLSLIHI